MFGVDTKVKDIDDTRDLLARTLSSFGFHIGILLFCRMQRQP